MVLLLVKFYGGIRNEFFLVWLLILLEFVVERFIFIWSNFLELKLDKKL